MTKVTYTSRIPRITSGLSDDVDRTIKVETEQIATAARGKAPIRTGRLRDSIEVVAYHERGFIGWRVTADARANPVQAKGGGMREGAPYAHMIEFGSIHNRPAHPFMVPALEENQDATLRAVQRTLDAL